MKTVPRESKGFAWLCVWLLIGQLLTGCATHATSGPALSNGETYLSLVREMSPAELAQIDAWIARVELYCAAGGGCKEFASYMRALEGLLLDAKSGCEQGRILQMMLNSIAEKNLELAQTLYNQLATTRGVQVIGGTVKILPYLAFNGEMFLMVMPVVPMPESPMWQGVDVIDG